METQVRMRLSHMDHCPVYAVMRWMMNMVFSGESQDGTLALVKV
jgi:hypothetical protein